MADRNEKMNLTITVNGKSAGSNLRELQTTATLLNKQLRELPIGTEQFAQKAQELKKVNTALAQLRAETKGTSNEVSGLKGIFQKALGPMVAFFAVERILNWGKEIFNIGVETDSLAKKFNTVFGEAAATVEASADMQANALGLTKKEYLEAATAAADLLIPMGFTRQEAANLSTDLTGLSGALSVWTNGKKSATEVSSILNKALLGEREQLKELGISISEDDVKQRLARDGKEKLTGTLLQQAKAQATLQLITEKSQDAQTGFAKGSEDLVQVKARTTAKIKDLVENLSRGLMPAYTAILKVGSQVVDFIVRMVTSLTSGEKATGKFSTAINFAVGYLQLLFDIGKFVFNILTSLVSGAIDVVKALSTWPIIGTIINSLKGIFAGIISFISNAGASISGFKAAVSQGLENLKKFFYETYLSIQQIAKEIDLALSIKQSTKDRLRKEIEDIESLRKQSKDSGKSIAQAYDEGFNEYNQNKKRDSFNNPYANEGSGNSGGGSGGTGGGSGEGGGGGSGGSGSKNVKQERVAPLALLEARTSNNPITGKPIDLAGSVDFKKSAEERLAFLEDQLKRELLINERGFLQKLFTEEQYEMQILDKKQEYLNKQLEALKIYGQENTLQYQEIANEILRIDEERAKKQQQTEERHAAIVNDINNRKQQLTEGAINAGIALLSKDEAARKRNASAIKAFEIARIIVNAKSEISGYFKGYSDLPFIGQALAIGQAVAAGLRAAAAIREITAQKFYLGGRAGLENFSGRISSAPNVSTQPGGDNVLGLLKRGEVVLTEAQQYKAGGPAFFRKIGVPGFNVGGIVDPISVQPASLPGLNSNAGLSLGIAPLINKIDSLFQRLGDIEVSATISYDAMEEAKNTVNLIKNRANT